MAYRHKDLNQLKRMPLTALKRKEKEARITLLMFFNGKATEKEASEANKTVRCICRFGNQEYRDQRLWLHIAAMLKKHPISFSGSAVSDGGTR